MKKDIFVVHDNKVGAFAIPFYAENQAVALRSFRYAANDKSTEVGKYPSDYSLYQLGTYDDTNATFDLLPAPKHLAIASTLIEE